MYATGLQNTNRTLSCSAQAVAVSTYRDTFVWIKFRAACYGLLYHKAAINLTTGYTLTFVLVHVSFLKIVEKKDCMRIEEQKR